MQKWQSNGAGPIQIGRFNKAWSSLNWEHKTYNYLSGVIGEKEFSGTQTELTSSRQREDVAAVQESIGGQFEWTLTAANAAEVVKAIEAELEILKANRPVKDQRVTAEARSAARAESSRIAEEQKVKTDAAAAAFVSHYGNGQKVTVQPGQMAVTAQIHYDNSDSMTDYFDRHASLSQPFALLIVPKQAETERLARRGLAVSAALSALEFEWHTEKYSMGHGNYLESKGGFELPAELQGLRNRYGSGEGVKFAHWEITFRHTYSKPVELDAIAGYGTQPATPETVSVTDVTISENEEKDGLEIRFPAKPSAEVLDALKANGWRWSRFSSCWYARRSDKARQFAASLTAA